jgi:hypothetical protein
VNVRTSARGHDRERILGKCCEWLLADHMDTARDRFESVPGVRTVRRAHVEHIRTDRVEHPADVIEGLNLIAVVGCTEFARQGARSVKVAAGDRNDRRTQVLNSPAVDPSDAARANDRSFQSRRIVPALGRGDRLGNARIPR